MNFLLRLFLTFSSVSFFVIIYLIGNKIPADVGIPSEYNWIIYISYLIIPPILTAISLVFAKELSSDSLNGITSIEASNNDFLANYLAFFFVALSITDWLTFGIVFGLTLLFTFYSRVSYFNPILLLFGFYFYYVTTSAGIKVMLISKKKLKDPKNFESSSVHRINDYTFIEI